MNSLYGYKVCYVEQGHRKINKYGATNNFWLAKEMKKDFENTTNFSRKKKYHKLHNPSWFVMPVIKKKEYIRIWKGCPF